jgi:hypothetical protein
MGPGQTRDWLTSGTWYHAWRCRRWSGRQFRSVLFERQRLDAAGIVNFDAACFIVDFQHFDITLTLTLGQDVRLFSLRLPLTRLGWGRRSLHENAFVSQNCRDTRKGNFEHGRFIDLNGVSWRRWRFEAENIPVDDALIGILRGFRTVYGNSRSGRANSKPTHQADQHLSTVLHSCRLARTEPKRHGKIMR